MCIHCLGGADFPLDLAQDLSQVTPTPTRHLFPKTLLLSPRRTGLGLACFPPIQTSLSLPEVVLEALAWWLGFSLKAPGVFPDPTDI